MKTETLLFFQIFTHSVFCQLHIRRLYCPFERFKLGINVTDPFHIEYVKIGEWVSLPCCQKFATSGVRKDWYKRNRLFTDAVPTNLDTVYYIMDHVISNIQETDAGIYYCSDYGVPLHVNTFFYIVDVEYEGAPVVRGKFDAYEAYMEHNINSINSYLSQPNNTEIISFFNDTKITLRAVIRWEAWTECDFCKGEKVRKGHCHLQPDVHLVGQCSLLNCQIYKHALQMDCRSPWTISKLFPGLAERVKDIPDFEGVAKCVGPCSADIIPGIDYVKKLRTRLLLAGRSSVFGCPGHTRKNKCYWRRNGIKLTSDDYDPTRKVSVNEFCLLYFVDVTKEEAGNYTCYVNEQLVQQNKVIVDELYEEKKQSLQRHVKYLLYIILICFVILVGGIAIGCLQQQNFKKINEEEVIEMYRRQRFEHERLLPPSAPNDE